MIPEYNYSEFKRKLTTNPKWMLRGLVVILHSPDIATPTNVDEIRRWLTALEDSGGLLPLGYGAVVDILNEHAPNIYRFYRHRISRGASR